MKKMYVLLQCLFIASLIGCGTPEGGGDVTSDNGSTDDGATDDGTTDDGATDDGTTDDGATDDGATDGGTTDDGTTASLPSTITSLIATAKNESVDLTWSAVEGGRQLYALLCC